MKTLRKIYCRTFQTGLKIALPFLPYRTPKVAGSVKALPKIIQKKNCRKVLIITDEGIRKLGLTLHLEKALTDAKIPYCIYDKTVANPTTDNVAEAVRLYRNVPHGLANAVILPMMLEAYGKTIHKKLAHLAIAAGLADKDTPWEEAAGRFIQAIKDMKKRFGIGDRIPEIQQKDIRKLARYADKEANPLYPVPVLMDALELEPFYYRLMGDKKEIFDRKGETEHDGTGN